MGEIGPGRPRLSYLNQIMDNMGTGYEENDPEKSSLEEENRRPNQSYD